jgi:hypothetical protein
MAAVTPKTYTGEDAKIWIGTNTHTTVGMGDFTLTLDRGIVEQELLGEVGNYFTQGALSIDGSFTHAQWAEALLDTTIGSLVNGTMVSISGSTGPHSLRFYFKSCQITNFDLTLGDASTVTEGSVDFTVLDPYNITKTAIGVSGMRITD